MRWLRPTKTDDSQRTARWYAISKEGALQPLLPCQPDILASPDRRLVSSLQAHTTIASMHLQGIYVVTSRNNNSALPQFHFIQSFSYGTSVARQWCISNRTTQTSSNPLYNHLCANHASCLDTSLCVTACLPSQKTGLDLFSVLEPVFGIAPRFSINTRLYQWSIIISRTFEKNISPW
jgi:hypothetical protein